MSTRAERRHRVERHVMPIVRKDDRGNTYRVEADVREDKRQARKVNVDDDPGRIDSMDTTEHDRLLAQHAQLIVKHLGVSWDPGSLRIAAAEADAVPQLTPWRLEDVPDFAWQLTQALLKDPGAFADVLQDRIETYLRVYLTHADKR